MTDEKTDGAALVRRAFAIARDSGKADWRRMTIPVLKNRILMITGNQFSEQQFNAATFREFLGALPAGLIVLDLVQKPGVATLVDDDSLVAPAHHSRYSQVRPDLWRAVLDYSSNVKYVWDVREGRARPAHLDETAPILPTVSSEDFDSWRSAFQAKHSSDFSGDWLLRLNRWTAERLPTDFLPTRVRALWNSELKERVEERLRTWFTKNTLQVPADLFTHPPAARRATTEEGESLRRFALRCVRAMTDEELRQLVIPVQVAHRARGSRDQ